MAATVAAEPRACLPVFPAASAQSAVRRRYRPVLPEAEEEAHQPVLLLAAEVAAGAEYPLPVSRRPEEEVVAAAYHPLSPAEVVVEHHPASLPEVAEEEVRQPV